MSNEKTFNAVLKNDGWKLRDSFCGVYLYNSKNSKYQIIYNVMDTVVKVLTGKLMNEKVWEGSLEDFVANYSGFSFN